MASASYTLHVAPHADPGDPAALERATLVRDGFSWAAFVAPGLWLFWHRHWLAGLAAWIVVVGLAVGLAAAGARPGTIVAAELILHVLFGLEGASLRRLSLARAGRPVRDVVVASDLSDAEAKSFARWLAPGEGPVRAAPRAVVPVAGRPGFGAPGPVLGLFPEPGGRA